MIDFKKLPTEILLEYSQDIQRSSKCCKTAFKQLRLAIESELKFRSETEGFKCKTT